LSLSTAASKVKAYPRYTWVGNQISQDAMAEMYRIRKATGKPITRQVAEAVMQYLQAEGTLEGK
jgi:hypothetical protein